MSERILALLLLGTLAAGCAGPRPAAGASTESAMSRPDSVEVRLDAPARVKAGSAIPFHLTLSNLTDRPVTLYLLGRDITYDVTVAAADGRTVWQRLDEGMIQGILAVRTLSPHEVIGLDSEWSGSHKPGSYSASGAVLTDGEPLRSRAVRIEIEP